MENKELFKIGDKVFDIRCGWGVVVELYHDDFNPIGVEFKIEGVRYTHYYTRDGKSSVESLNPTLSFKEYTLEGFSQERPVNYDEYIGKWGKFRNIGFKTSHIAKLDKYEPIRINSFFSSEGRVFNCFQPLTEEQIKILGLETEK